MHILYFHQHFSTPRGAGGIRSYQMAKALLARGHQVTMVCGSNFLAQTGLDGPFVRGRRSGQVEGIEVIEFDLSYSNHDSLIRRSWLFLKFALGAISIALRLDYDRAFATTTPLTVALPVLAGRWFRGKPYIFEVRDLWPELPRAMGVITNPLLLWLLGRLERLAYRFASRSIGLAPGIVDGIAATGVEADRIAMLPNGCDLEIFGQRAASWRPDGVTEKQLLAVFTGTHGVANGLGAVLNAAELLQQRGRHDVQIVLIGDGRLKAQLKEQASKLGLKNVHFLDPVSKGNLAGLLAGADIGLQVLANVQAFYYGTSPNKFFDYMAAGLPVLTNYPGWVADMVRDQGVGFAVPPDDPAAFADALQSAADNRSMLPAMSRGAAALARREFDRAVIAERWVDWVTGRL
jgi:glycosyltransferase involved in cell wall biosynthesis